MTNGEWLEKFTKTEAKEWVKSALKACLGGGLVGVGIALIANNCYDAGKNEVFMSVGEALKNNESFFKSAA